MRKSLIVSKRQMSIVEKSIASMVQHIGPEVYSLPVNIEHDLTQAPAYITKDGIWIRRDIAQQDGRNVRVYLMHEIFHPVVANPELMKEFNHKLTNVADDYHINYLIKKLFGKDYDVKQVKFPGLYNARLGKLHPYQCAQTLIARERRKKANQGKDLVFSGACGCRGIYHPAIRQMADQIRKKYNLYPKDHQGPMIVFDKLDERKFDAVADDIRYNVELPRIQTDLTNLTRNLFMKAYLDNPMSVPGVQGQLTTQQALTYCWDTSKFRNLTEFNEDESALAVSTFLVNCSIHGKLLLWKIQSLSERIDRLSRKIKAINSKCAKKGTDPRRSKMYRRYVRQITALNIALKRWSAKKPIHVLLATDPVYAIKRTSFKTVALSSKFKRSTSVATPKIVSVKSNETTQAIRWLSSVSGKAYQNLSSLRKQIEKTMGPLMGDEEDANKTDDETNEGKGEGEGKSEGDESGAGNGNQPGAGKNENGKNENDAGSTKPDKVDKNGAGGQGVGKGEGSQRKTTLTTLLSLAPAEQRMLANIMAYVQEFETALHVKKSRKYDEFANTIDLIPTTGSELEKVQPYELALLNNKYTRMAFFMKLANNSLTILQPQENKRQPIAMCVDASGSMDGPPYEMACGFAIAMLKKLAEDKRGGVFTVFSSSVTHSLTLVENKRFDLIEIIKILATPQFGGTSFDAALSEVYKIKKEQRWKAMTTLMITDGDDSVSDPVLADVMRQKGSMDHITLVLTGRGMSASGLRGLNDDTVVARKRDLQVALERIGNSLL